MKAPYRWVDLTWEEIGAVAKKDNAVVILPVGSVEQHGRHLPVQTDTVLVSSIAERAVQQVGTCVPVLLAPTVPIGCSEHHMEFPGTLTLTEETFIRALTEIGLSVARQGFRRLFFLNGHGGNAAPLEIVVNKIRHQTHGCVLCVTASYWRLMEKDVQEMRRSAPGGISHSGEFETSTVMALDESLVLPEKAEKFLPRWTNGYFAPGWFVPSKVTLGFHLKDITESGVVGDPTVASKENGERFLKAAARAVGEFVEAFAGWELGNLYEQPSDG